MKIVFVIDTYNEAGGGSVATKRLVNELRKRGHNIKVIAAVNDDNNDPDFFEVPRLIMPMSHDIHASRNFYLGKGKKSVLLEAMIDADIIQIQYPFLLAKSAVKIANKLNIPVIGAFHIQPQNILLALGNKNKHFEKLIWYAFKYFLFNRVDTIVAPSLVASQLLKYNGVKANILTISNGITLDYVKRSLIKPNWFNNHFVILSIGRHANEKRHKLIIDGIKKSKYSFDIQLILAGKGELTSELRKEGDSLPIKPLIEYVSFEDKILYLSTADLYVHASNIELESLSTSEAIGCGLPSLISNSVFSAASQFALDERFLFNADNADDLGNKIDYWYENRIELQSSKMKEKIQTIADKFKINDSIDKFESLYMEIKTNFKKNNYRKLV